MKIATVSQMRSMDRQAVDQYGIPERLLMENAGLAACAAGAEGLDRVSAERIWHELRRLLEAPDHYLTRIRGSKLWHLSLLEFWLQRLEFDGPAGLDDWLVANPQALDALYSPVTESPWSALVFLSFAAAFLLPRQFHMLFAENLDPRGLRTATWAMPSSSSSRSNWRASGRTGT